jgi:integrase/recombinase XerD
MAYRKLPAKRLKRGPGPNRRPASATEIEILIDRYLEWQRVRHYAESTRVEAGRNLRWLADWLAERGITQPTEVSLAVLERYQAALFYHRKADGEPLSIVSQRSRLSAMRIFFRWLARKHHVPANPASEIELPKQPQVLKAALTIEEMEAVLAVPDTDDVLGLRDRAILELFYSTGLRRAELIGLQIYDLDRSRGRLHVRQGKGKKDRMLPTGERALAWIEAYLSRSRPSLERGFDEGELFLTDHGETIGLTYLSGLVRKYFDRAGITKRGGCHLLRHTMATLMLEGGADIRFIQRMLGHAHLGTTQIYTQVSLGKLEEIHAATHPGACLQAKERDLEAEDQAEAEHRQKLEDHGIPVD